MWYRWIALDLILLLPWLPLDCEGTRTLFFQSSNVPSNESRAWKILVPPSPGAKLVNLTVALWFKVHHFRDSTYIFSYATSDKDDNELNMAIRDKFNLISIGNTVVYSTRDLMNKPDVWYHFAVVIDNKKYSIYINGELNNEGTISKRSILLNGSLVLGQETDIFNGDFNDMQSFSGQIADFKNSYFTIIQVERNGYVDPGMKWVRNLSSEDVRPLVDLLMCVSLFSRPLGRGEVARLVECSAGRASSLFGDVAALETDFDTWNLVGELAAENAQFSEICQRSSSEVQIFPDPSKWKEAKSLCDKLKSDVFVPYTESINTEVYDAVVGFVDRCKPKNHASSFMWLGITDAAEEGTWTDFRENALNFTSFTDSGMSELQDCASYEKPPDDYKWNDVPCTNTYDFCVACSSVNRTVFKLRGLCEQNIMNYNFLMEQTLNDYKHHFRGFTKYSLTLQKDSENKSSWVLSDMWAHNLTLAKLTTHTDAYPLGLANWTVLQDFQLCDMQQGSSILLSLSACNPDEFTCNRGTCIDLQKRCDLRADCPDASDEVGCDKVLMPPEYIPSLPPHGQDRQPLLVNISITIRSFSEIDIRNMMIKVDMNVEMFWLESRLKYKNLREIQDINFVNSELVWSPDFDLLNANFPEVYRTTPRVTVKKITDPQPDDLSLPIHDEIFLGEDNPLHLSRKVNAPFSCDMDLKNFPFDIQYCSLLFQMSSARADFATWANVEVVYEGERLLTEYEVGQIRTGEKVINLHSVAVVQVPLYGRYWFYVTSSYLPILMLLIISYASLFCRAEDSELRIMMALTALLVLYALYQQISDGLPKTSYTKAVDIWCFFAITLIFSQTIFHVAVDYPMWPRFCTKTNLVTKVKDVGSLSSLNSVRSPDCEKLLYVSRVVYVVVFAVFFVIYWSVVLTSKSNLEKQGLCV